MFQFVLIVISIYNTIKINHEDCAPRPKGARKSECAPTRENSPSGQFSKNIPEVEDLNELLLWCRCDSAL